MKFKLKIATIFLLMSSTFFVRPIGINSVKTTMMNRFEKMAVKYPKIGKFVKKYPKTTAVLGGAYLAKKVVVSGGLCYYGYSKYIKKIEPTSTSPKFAPLNTAKAYPLATGAIVAAAAAGLGYGAYWLWNWSKPTKFESKPEQPKKKKTGKHVTFHPSVK